MTDQADTPDPIGAWLALGGKATLGPWVSRPDLAVYVEHWHVSPIATLIVRRADGEFIAASRNVVPAARALVAELAAARDREAAVLAMHPKQTTHLSGGGGVLSDSAGFNARAAQFLGLPVEYCGRCQNPEVQRWPCATVAALSQSEPTKETP